MRSFDLERTSAWMGLTVIMASNADIANVAARSENIAFMTLRLIGHPDVCVGAKRCWCEGPHALNGKR